MGTLNWKGAIEREQLLLTMWFVFPGSHTYAYCDQGKAKEPGPLTPQMTISIFVREPHAAAALFWVDTDLMCFSLYSVYIVFSCAIRLFLKMTYVLCTLSDRKTANY
jgi:hypothetical protein